MGMDELDKWLPGGRVSRREGTEDEGPEAECTRVPVWPKHTEVGSVLGDRGR